MQLLHHVHSLRDALNAARNKGKKIGLVPTMGNLHDAHLALVKQAQAACDVVVVSIFVNRLQFGLNEDWDKYPRTLERDAQKLKAIGCDYIFCPEESEIYPNGMDTQTRVIVPTMANALCGASRPGHFDGVTTVVAKLFNIVEPDVAVFGLKDYQQLAIIRRMAEDLCLSLTIEAGDIVREPDGLAMSSRNTFITEQERPHANILNKQLNSVKAEIESGNVDFLGLQAVSQQVISEAGFKPDYFSICNSKTLELAAQDDKHLTILGAMYTQGARLIDNISLRLPQ